MIVTQSSKLQAISPCLNRRQFYSPHCSVGRCMCWTHHHKHSCRHWDSFSWSKKRSRLPNWKVYRHSDYCTRQHNNIRLFQTYYRNSCKPLSALLSSSLGAHRGSQRADSQCNRQFDRNTGCSGPVLHLVRWSATEINVKPISDGARSIELEGWVHFERRL